jgi:hypothetical protein
MGSAAVRSRLLAQPGIRPGGRLARLARPAGLAGNTLAGVPIQEVRISMQGGYMANVRFCRSAVAPRKPWEPAQHAE